MPDKILITNDSEIALLDYLINIAVGKIRNGDHDSFLFVVPDPEVLEAIKVRILENTDINGLRDKSFVTIGSLVRDLNVGSKTISVCRLRMMLEDVLTDPSSGLSNLGEFPGFRRRVEKLFSEIRSVPSQDRKKVKDYISEKYPDGSAGNGIIKKLLKVFENLQANLEEEGFDTRESSFEKACLSVKERGSYKNVLVAGFDLFSQYEWAFIDALADKSERLYVTIPYTESWRFNRSSRSREYALKSGFKEEVLMLLRQEKGERKKENLADSFSLGICDPPDKFELKLVDSKRDEADYIARKVALFIQDGYKPQDIAVVHPRPSDDESIYLSAFDKLGIPSRSILPRSLKEISPVREVLAILELLEGNYDESISLASSRFAIDASHLVVHLDQGILDSIMAGEKVKKPEDIDKKVWTNFTSLVKDTKKISEFATFRSLIRKITESFLVLPTHIPDDPTMLASTSWRTFQSLLSDLTEYYSSESEVASNESRFREFLSGLREQVNGTIIRPRDRRKSAVDYMGMKGTRLRDAKIVFLVGMNDKKFPRISRTDPLLGETSRQDLLSQGYDFTTSKDIYDEDSYLLYTSLNCASRKMIITVPIRDEGGETLEISSSLMEAFPTGWKSAKEDDPGLYTIDDFIVRAASWQGDSQSVPEAVLKSLLKQTCPRGLKALSTLASTDVEFNAEITSEYIDVSKSYSASSLENYATCPFIYFAERILKLPGAQTSLDKTISPMDRGIAIHEYLAERIMNPSSKLRLRDLLEKQGVDLSKLDFIEEAGLESYIAIVDEFVEAELQRIENERRQVYQAEYEFGAGDGSELVISTSKGSRRFRGKIDRIDLLEDGTYSVIDYKTSSQSVSVLFEDASKFQLPLYAIALKNQKLEPSMAEIIVLSKKDVDDANTSKSKSEEWETFEEFVEKGRQNIINVVEMIESGKFNADPSDKEFCGWNKCAYYHVCRTLR